MFMHMRLALMDGHELPLALGVIRSVDAPTYEQEVADQIASVKARKKERTLREYLLSGDTWEVK